MCLLDQEYVYFCSRGRSQDLEEVFFCAIDVVGGDLGWAFTWKSKAGVESV
jgi:hypothetical protein